MTVTGTKLRGARDIYAIGTHQNCAERIKKYGATDIISYKEGGKVDCSIIADGSIDSMNQALMLVKNNGTIANVNFYDVTDTFNVPTYLWGLGMSDITIRGAFCPGGAYRI